MELRQLRYFVAIAEELSFRRAAERLNISQPPLSLHVQHLEAELQAELFRREKRRISLTPAGEELLRSARALIALERRAAADVKRAALGEHGRLRLGFSDDHLYNEAPRLVADLHKTAPALLVESEVGFSLDLANRVADGSLDAAMICPPLPGRLTGVEHRSLAPAAIQALLPSGHALSDAPVIDLVALRDERFIFPARFHATGFFIQVMKLFDDAGFVPSLAHETSTLEFAVQLVANGLGAGLVTEWSVPPEAPGVRRVPLSDPEALVKRSLIWRPDNRNPVLGELLRPAAPQAAAG